MSDSKNMEIYDLAREVPNEAKKEISAGRLKGMTDINPMWRIKRLTEIFGSCGIGWWYEVTDKRLVEDQKTNQTAAFVDILLFYKYKDIESKGIPGTGGSSFVSREAKGPYMSDECFKMALTDAISVAAKALGVGADVYFAADSTKYTGATVERATNQNQIMLPNNPGAASKQNPVPNQPTHTSSAPQYHCIGCGQAIDARVNAFSISRYGRPLCRQCQQNV